MKYERDLEKNPANYAPLTPLSFVERAAYVYPDRVSVIHGAQRYTWQQTYARCRRLAYSISDREASDALLALAADYERNAWHGLQAGAAAI